MKVEGALLIEINGVGYVAIPVNSRQQGWAPCPLCGGQVERAEQRVLEVETNRETVYPSLECRCGLTFCAPTEQALYQGWHRRAP